jgi:hypothetical protein
LAPEEDEEELIPYIVSSRDWLDELEVPKSAA